MAEIFFIWTHSLLLPFGTYVRIFLYYTAKWAIKQTFVCENTERIAKNRNRVHFPADCTDFCQAIRKKITGLLVFGLVLLYHISRKQFERRGGARGVWVQKAS
nr:hypothetical protein [uncultured Agathobaculum sp.]